MWAWWLNTAWMLRCSSERALFARACRRVSATQTEILRQTLRANRATWYGRQHGFADIASPRAFQARVPPTTYDNLVPLVDRIAAGEAGVLTREPVLLLEPTSGTMGGEKLIPYTAGLRRQFQRGVASWIADLFYHRSAIRAGRAYWSLSPHLGPSRRTLCGIPIGFEDDAAYLGQLEQYALRHLLVVPGTVRRSRDIEAFRRATLRYLLAAEDLTLISIWNPTFLTALLAPLLDDSLPAAWWQSLDRQSSSSEVQRALHVQAIWKSSTSLPDKVKQTWPHLSLISCWTDAAAQHFLPALQRWFPTVEIQPKGLLATEGFVSFPLVDRPGAALALRCHFFEFEEVATNRYLLAHQLEQGGRYRVLLTTAGGLYRYPLRDEVEVVGFHHQCPLLRFLGKSDLVSDLVGEKLAEQHVRAILDRWPALQRLSPVFRLLVPVCADPPRYRLYLQTDSSPAKTHAILPQLRAELQAALEENPYYRHAVAVGQLAPVEIVLLRYHGESAWLIYERGCLERGQKCGNIKPVALDRWTGWQERFAPLVDSSASIASFDCAR